MTNFQLSADERALFQGDIAVYRGTYRATPAEGMVTTERFRLGEHTGEKPQIIRIEESRYFLGTKVHVHLADGEVLTLGAQNPQRLMGALQVLTGLRGEATLTDPDLKAVKNGTAWFAALGPTISGFAAALLGWVLWGDEVNWAGMALLALWVPRLVVIHLCLLIDFMSLQQQGYTPVKLGIYRPTVGPSYLFSRARAFGRGKGYAVVWCVSLAFEVFATLYLLFN